MDVEKKQNLDKAGEQGQKDQRTEISNVQDEHGQQPQKPGSLSSVVGGLIGAAVGGLTGGRVGAVVGAAVGAVAAKALRGEDPVEQARGAVQSTKEHAAEFIGQAKERATDLIEQTKERADDLIEQAEGRIEAIKEVKDAGNNGPKSEPIGHLPESEAATAWSKGIQSEQQASELSGPRDMASIVKAAYDKAVEMQKPAEHQAPVK